MKYCKLLLFSLIFWGGMNTISSQNNKISTIDEIEKLSGKLGIEISEHSLDLSLYKEVVKWLGTRYRRGGMSFKGVDCSGFTGSVYKAVFDKQLNRRSIDMANNVLTDVEKEDLEPGDMVFFATSRRKNTINHVGIYLKDNKFVHASCGKGVIVSNLDDPYYKRAWKKGGRVNEVQNKYRFAPLDISMEVLMCNVNVVSIREIDNFTN